MYSVVHTAGSGETTCTSIILVVDNSPCQGTDVFTPDPGICQPPFTSYPPPLPEGEGEMTSPPAHSTWAGVVNGQPPPAVSPDPSPPPSAHLLHSVVQGLFGEGDMGQTDFRDKGRRRGTQLLMKSPIRSSYIKSSQRSHSSPQSLQKAG